MDEETPRVVKAVFQNDMLRDHILDFSIHNTTETICRKTVCSVRLVQKCWMLSVTNIMRRNKQPLYKLVLDGVNSINGTRYVQQHGKILDQFLHFISNRSETFCLFIKPEFFRSENYQSFLAILRLAQANQGLVEINMLVPINGGSLPCAFPNVVLSNLQKFNIEFTGPILNSLERDNSTFHHPTNIVLLFQSLLSRNESLKTLKITDNHIALPGIYYMSLPTTITVLNLDCFLTDDDFESLAQNKLPILSALRFIVPNRILRDDLIFRVLDNHRTTLEQLTFGNGKITSGPVFPNHVKFPVMEKLAKLGVASLNIRLHHRIEHTLDRCFPKLKLLEFAWQTEAAVKPWIENSNLEKVTGLTMHIIDLTELQRGCSIVLPSAELLQGVKRSMPNVQSLMLQIDARDTLQFRELLKEMTHLKSLRVWVNGAQLVVSSDLWDSCLTGIPLDILAICKVNPSYWNKFDVQMDDKPCIGMLKNLEILTLTSSQNHLGIGDFDLISQLSFRLALNKMTNLKVLNLSGRFRASDGVVREWRNQGRSIVYTEGPLI